MNSYITKLSQEELIDLINSLIESADKRKWDGKMPVIEGQINYVVMQPSDNGKIILAAKRIVGQSPYAVFDIGAFEADDFSICLIVWGGKYISFNTELHEALAVRFGTPYVEDYYEHEQERIVKENIRLTLLTGEGRK